MDRAYFSFWTCVLYVLVGILSAIFINGYMGNIGSGNVILSRKSHRQSRFYFILILFMLLFLAVFRKVTSQLGGADTLNYIYNFEYIFNGGLDRGNNTELEWGFQKITLLISYITDNYRVYFAFMYGIIVYGYMKFIKSRCPTGLSYIPFLLVMYLFLKSFNTMRTSVAISIMLIGLSYIDKSKWKSLLIIVSSVLIHRVSLLFVFVWPVCIIMEKKLPNLTRNKFIIVTLAGIVLSYLVSLRFQGYAIEVQMFEGTDAYYIQKNVGQDYLMRYPMFLAQTVLFIMLVLNYNSIKWDEKTSLLRSMFIYDLWVVPAALTLGMWRSVEYFYLARLSLWSVIIYAMTKYKTKREASLVKAIFFIVFIAWLVFRIYNECESARYSPYILDLGF